MKTISLNLYKFSELSSEAKETAVNDFRSNNYDNIFLDWFEDHCIEKIQEYGFEGNIKVSYSLGYSQGDGLSFSCSGIDTDLLRSMFTEVLGSGKEKTIEAILDYCTFKNSRNSGRYSYASKSDIDFYFEKYDCPNIELFITAVREKIEDMYINLCSVLETAGYSEIEYQNSDEYIIETIEANDYDFTADGKIY